VVADYGGGIMDFYDDIDNELMHEVRRIHCTFVEASEVACKALGRLLNELDHNGVLTDIQIERLYGSNVLAAYIQADKAFQDLECFFDENLD
jgi:hypothetical protein